MLIRCYELLHFPMSLHLIKGTLHANSQAFKNIYEEIIKPCLNLIANRRVTVYWSVWTCTMWGLLKELYSVIACIFTFFTIIHSIWKANSSFFWMPYHVPYHVQILLRWLKWMIAQFFWINHFSWFAWYTQSPHVLQI